MVQRKGLENDIFLDENNYRILHRVDVGVRRRQTKPSSDQEQRKQANSFFYHQGRSYYFCIANEQPAWVFILCIWHGKKCEKQKCGILYVIILSHFARMSSHGNLLCLRLVSHGKNNYITLSISRMLAFHLHNVLF